MVAAGPAAIGPGARGKLTVRLDSRGRTGQVEEYVTLSTNDPTQSQTVLVLKGMVQRTAKPESIRGNKR